MARSGESTIVRRLERRAATSSPGPSRGRFVALAVAAQEVLERREVHRGQLLALHATARCEAAEGGFAVGCACGWQSSETYPAQDAIAVWERHVADAATFSGLGPLDARGANARP